MVTMLVTINISKGWETWSEMAKGLEPQMNEVGSKILWAGCNADESAVYVLVEMKDPSFIKSFGERGYCGNQRGCRCRCFINNAYCPNWQLLYGLITPVSIERIERHGRQ